MSVRKLLRTLLAPSTIRFTNAGETRVEKLKYCQGNIYIYIQILKGFEECQRISEIFFHITSYLFERNEDGNILNPLKDTTTRSFWNPFLNTVSHNTKTGFEPCFYEFWMTPLPKNALKGNLTKPTLGRPIGRAHDFSLAVIGIEAYFSWYYFSFKIV